MSAWQHRERRRRADATGAGDAVSAAWLARSGAMRVTPGWCSPPGRCCQPRRGPVAGAGGQRGDAAGHRRGLVRDAGRALGYGFPIGGVAATDVAAGGVVSPGGVGFDISCGVRLLGSDADRGGGGRSFGRLMDVLECSDPARAWAGAASGRCRPRRAGRGAARRLAVRGRAGLRRPARPGPLRGLRRGGRRRPGAGQRAGAAARPGQVGSLGSGNHFLEVQAVERGLRRAGGGARSGCARPGLRDDPLRVAGAGPPDLLRPRPRSCRRRCPVRHPRAGPAAGLRAGRLAEGRRYLGAMAAAANYGRANRQLLATPPVPRSPSAGAAALDLVYDVSHNWQEIETHVVDGRTPDAVRAP